MPTYIRNHEYTLEENMSRNNGERNEDFPVKSLDQALYHLRRPPAPAAVKFKVQSVARDWGQIAAYVDARLVYDRLDRVCGENWHPVIEPLERELHPEPTDGVSGEAQAAKKIYARCRLTVFGVTRMDVGEGSDPKAAFSDAIKRAAVQFGIGRALYAMRTPWLTEGPKGEGQTLRRNGKGRFYIDDVTEKWCRANYGKWLEIKGAKQFGDPLDHGDEAGAAGFEEVEGTIDQARAVVDAGVVVADAIAQGEGEGAGEVSVEAGGLHAVPSEKPQEPPATPLARKRLMDLAKRAGFEKKVLKALSEFMFQEGIVDRLNAVRVRELATLIECAIEGGVTQKALAGTITKLKKRKDRGAARKALRKVLLDKAKKSETDKKAA